MYHYDKNILIYSSAGVIIGNCLSMRISQIKNRKKVSLICFFLYVIFYFIYTLGKQKFRWVVYISAFFISALKEYKDYFIPVWIDEFCKKKLKTISMFIYLTNEFGGYIENLILSMFLSNNFQLNIAKEVIYGVLILILDCLLLLFPNEYFSIKHNFIVCKIKEKEKEQLIKFENSEQKSSLENEEENNVNNNEIGLLKKILNNKVYVFSVLANICYLFANQVFQIKKIIGNELANYNKYFKILFLIRSNNFSKSRQYFGIIIEVICLLCIGGFENKNSSIFLSVCAIFSFFCFLAITLSDFRIAFNIGIVFFIFFSLPLITINEFFIINSITNKYKGYGVSLSLLLGNITKLVGFIFCGILFDKDNPSLDVINISLYILMVIFCLYSSFYRYRKDKNEENGINNEKELEDI
jgi:predicted MFS family arabinose efflux permease